LQQQRKLNVRITLPQSLPRLRMLLIMDNLSGHRTPSGEPRDKDSGTGHDNGCIDSRLRVPVSSARCVAQGEFWPNFTRCGEWPISSMLAPEKAA
jgi:hypothetical protein